MIYIQTRSMNPVQKVLATLLGLALLVLGVMFSIVVIPLVLLLGAIAAGYFYWKTRALRQAMAEAVRQAADAGGGVIEGEAVVVREETEIRHLPRH